MSEDKAPYDAGDPKAVKERWGMNDKELADWVVATCLQFGASVFTAYLVAGLFIKGLRRERG